jgi:myo-inositol-1-phosphate synthase
MKSGGTGEFVAAFDVDREKVVEHYWQGQFEQKGLPIIGDDIESQVGATIVHRTLARLFRERGVKLERTYQLNFGGNTDFVIDAVRCSRLALDHGLSGSLEGPSAYFMKSPARQYTDDDARRLTEEFITRYGRGSAEPSERRAAATQD